MLRFRKWGRIALAFFLLWSLLPWMNLPQAEGASGRYFEFPEQLEIQNSTPDNPYIHNRSTIDLRGLFHELQSDSIQLQTEQIYQTSEGVYETVEGRVYTRSVTTSENRFEILGLTLFEGLNKITFFGTQAGVTLENEFYIYFDSSPFLIDLTIRSNTDEASPLNAGTGTVVTSSDVFIEGRAPNATSIVVNGQFTVQPLIDGTFFSPVITLSPGKNKISLQVHGSNDVFTIERTIYYFDKQNLVFEGSMYFDYDGDGSIQPAEEQNQKPVVGSLSTFAVPFSSGTAISGGFVGKIMVPYVNSSSLTSTDIDVLVDGDATLASNLTISNPTPVRYGTTNEIHYEVYDISFNVLVDTSDAQNLTHSIDIETNYNGVQGMDNILFNFANNDSRIVEDVQWLYQYETDPTAKRPLQNAQINSSAIYVEVTKNKPFDLDGLNSDDDVLKVYLTPYAPDSTIITTYVSSVAASNKAIYKIENIPPGSHTMVINFEGTPSVYDYLANVDYVSGASAVFMNIFDGMTIKAENIPDHLQMMIRNVDANFAPDVNNAVLRINGVAVTDAFENYDQPGVPFLADIRDSSGTSLLRFGENRIKADLIYDGFLTTKEIVIYVVDNNLPMIQAMKPVLAPMSGARPDISDENDLRQLYSDMTGLTLQNGVYYTNAYKYDLIIEVNHFTKIELQYDGEQIIRFEKDGSPLESVFPTRTYASTDKTWVNNKRIDYDYDQVKDRLVLRIRDLEFPSPGSQVFNLKIATNTGTQANQRFEIVREETAYEVLSPQPTSDNKIIVNKNFVQIVIRAENADQVIVEKETAKRMREDLCLDCFELEYVGLRENRWNDLEFTVVRGDDEIDGEIQVYYANSMTAGAQYKEVLNRNMRVFDNALRLKFDNGTLLKTETASQFVPSFYENQRILFGIADPETGMVEYRTDEGKVKSANRALESRFRNFDQDFTFISPVYWISGGLAESGTPGGSGYKEKMHGIPPHHEDTSLTYTFVNQTRNLVPTKRGELTLRYDDIVRESAGIEVTVFYFDKNGIWNNIGGEINTKKHEITVPFDQFGYYVVGILRYAAPDIQAHPWAAEVLKAIYSKGFMDYARFMEFGADDYVTRGEYAQLLVKALQLQLNYDTRSTFIDVPYGSRYGNYWDYRYVETAARAGFIQGLQERVFAPNQTLTREQAAVMIARALELKLPINDEKLDAQLRKEFTDVDSMHHYAKPAIMAVFKDDIMLGEPTVSNGTTSRDTEFRFNPKAFLTRAQAAAIAVRVMQNELDYYPDNLN